MKPVIVILGIAAASWVCGTLRAAVLPLSAPSRVLPAVAPLLSPAPLIERVPVEKGIESRLAERMRAAALIRTQA
jgi:hypothetical protein